MGGWTFYDDAEWMNNSYPEVSARWKRERREAKGEATDSDLPVAYAFAVASQSSLSFDLELRRDHLRETREVRGDLNEGDPDRVRVERYLTHLEAYRADADE
jgi:hypothetical protein